ncbi:MAG: SUMF1/EgtB/PvdO family nonheme iron enzyme [Phycisphaerae bacterium]|nr:SUMF1/EgtB/PvdO family nonheme iron enzyme [Phycisphaerae bacterium]
MRRLPVIVGLLGGVLALGWAAQAEVVIEWVTVGDAANAPDTRYETPGYGGVTYVYRIAKCEVTNGQYIEFLNAVAATDANELYDAWFMPGQWGGIDRAGDPGSYSYGPKGGDTNWLNKPVNFVDFYSALRLANWMHNEQPTGDQGETTTEDGAYDMSLGENVVRKPGARVFLTSEDEWYKAAYYKGGGLDAGYWDYATQSDVLPTAEAPPGENMVNGSANYFDGENWVVGPPYYSNDVGAYTAKPSVSAYGTFDQSGNMCEWNEAVIEVNRGVRGGAWFGSWFYLPASYRGNGYPMDVCSTLGFRLASPPCNDGDADQDGDVDLRDFAQFQLCFSGDGAGDCECLDMDNDNDIDIGDFESFSVALDGPAE